MVESSRELAQVAGILTALRHRAEQRHGRMGEEQLAGRLGVAKGTMRSYLAGTRMPRPQFVRALAELAGVAPEQPFVDLGWLPAASLRADDRAVPADLGGRLTGLAGSVGDLARRLMQLEPVPGWGAPLAATAAVLHDPRAASRFSVRMHAVEAGDRYRTTLFQLAEFTPAAETAALDGDGLARLAFRTGQPVPALPEAGTGAGAGPGAPAGAGAGAKVGAEPGRDAAAGADAEHVAEHGTGAQVSAEHARLRAELVLRTAAALRGTGTSSWQGDPGTVLWRGHAATWPAHLLVQNVLGGVRRTEHAPLRLPDGLPLVAVGGDWSLAGAAALLAESLGWAFLPVDSTTVFDAGGVTDLPPRDRRADRRSLGWSSAATGIAQRRRIGTAWPAVFLVRSYVFAPDDPYGAAALDLLAETPARVLWADPSAAQLRWWALRREHAARVTVPAGRWAAAARVASDRVTEILRERRRRYGPGHDLALRFPEPPSAYDPDNAAFPADLVDRQFLLAWQALTWLDRTANRGRASLLSGLRPSRLTDQRAQLDRDWDPLPDI
jgi:transcriptional regulator with XRE-family HTH domain